MGRRKERWTEGKTDGSKERQSEGKTDGRIRQVLKTEGKTDGRKGRQKGRLKDGRKVTEERKDRQEEGMMKGQT